MLDVAICDDDIHFSGELEMLLFDMEREYGVKFAIDSYHDGLSLVEAIKSGRRYDIICLDIRMDGIDGMETARRIRGIDRVAELVYVTCYDRFMKEAFEVRSSGFIVKPLNRDEFETTFRRIMQRIKGQDAYYRFRFMKEDYKLLIGSILYFARDLRKTHINWEGGRCIVYKNLEEIKSVLDSNDAQFLRIHKSYLVNYRHIIRFSYDEVEMSNGVRLTISSRRKHEVDEQMMRMEKLKRAMPR